MIFLDTNVASEPAKIAPDPRVMSWLIANDADLALPAVALAEIARGVARLRPNERPRRLDVFLAGLAAGFADRTISFDDKAALLFGEIMGDAERNGRKRSAADGMIAATALRHGAMLATRNVEDFRFTGLKIVNPWDAHRA